MKKVFLFCVIVAIAMVARAQEVTLGNLLVKPALTNADVFNSSLGEIVDEWGVTANGNSAKKMMIGMSGYTYAGANMSSISLNDNEDSRMLSLFFLFDEDSAVSQDEFVAKLLADFQSLGFGELTFNGESLVASKNLPLPYRRLMMYREDEIVTIILKFGKGQKPDF